MKRAWLIVGLLLASLIAYRCLTFPTFGWHTWSCVCDTCLMGD